MEGSWNAADNPGGALSFDWLVGAGPSCPVRIVVGRELTGLKEASDSGLLTGGYYNYASNIR
jgi:hypothetical protein